MNNNLSRLFDEPVQWVQSTAPDTDVALSCRIRLARNLRDIPFPHRASQEERDQVFEDTMNFAEQRKEFHGGWACGMNGMGNRERLLLLERRLITNELARQGRGSGFASSFDGMLAVLINEEDHFRLQCLLPGFQLEQAWKKINALDDQLIARFIMATDEQLGFLTSCPTNAGTGMRASVMLQLPALALSQQLDCLKHAALELGMIIRGTFGEGSQAVGDFYQLSNQTTLGESEAGLLERLSKIVRRLIVCERNTRINLAAERHALVRDHVGRAYGLLKYAARITYNEALAGLGAVRLGIDLGLLPALELQPVDQLIIRVQPGHLQRTAGRDLEAEERDTLRAQIIRRTLFPRAN